MDQRSVSLRELTIEQTQEQEIFLRSVRIRLIKIIKYFYNSSRE